MKRIFAVAVICAMPISASLADGHGGNDEAKKYAAESKAVVMEFFKQVKGEMQSTMKASGPIDTIEVCSKTAPSIAKAFSEKHGMTVARTTLKPRNPVNAPDAWEEKVLKKFEERLAAGEKPEDMAFFEIVEADGKKNFRFMKAIGMPPLDKAPCLKCHGESIDPTISTKLDELYPEDKARGYKAGQIRGAFTITKSLD
ncbi:MAG: DUF3365 domain-containing protein [Chromatiales bacterium]|nr:DUF3365 domain-containing protein [Chromatiales bacterium]